MDPHFWHILGSTDAAKGITATPDSIPVDLSWIDELSQPVSSNLAGTTTAEDDIQFTTTISDHEPQDISDQQLRRLTQSLYRRCTALGPFREDVRQARDQATYELDGYQQKRDFLCESQLEFMTELESVMQQPFFTEHVAAAKLRDQHKILQQDHRNVINLTRDIRTSEIKVSEMEIELESVERQIGRAARRVLRYLDRSNLINADDLTTTAGSGGDPVMKDQDLDDHDGLLTEYRRRATEAALMLERVQQLREEHAEDRTSRNFQLDRDEPVEGSDEDFDSTQLSELRAVIKDYEEALNAESEARAACVLAGLSLPTATIQSPNQRPVDVTLQEVGLIHSLASSSSGACSDRGEAKADLTRVLSDMVLSEKTGTSTRVSAVTGPVFGSVSPIRRTRHDRTQVRAAVEKWIHETTRQSADYEAVPSDIPLCTAEDGTIGTPTTPRAIESAQQDIDDTVKLSPPRHETMRPINHRFPTEIRISKPTLPAQPLSVLQETSGKTDSTMQRSFNISSTAPHRRHSVDSVAANPSQSLQHQPRDGEGDTRARGGIVQHLTAVDWQQPRRRSSDSQVSRQDSAIENFIQQHYSASTSPALIE